jgi:hypothetical protein
VELKLRSCASLSGSDRRGAKAAPMLPFINSVEQFQRLPTALAAVFLTGKASSS